MLDVGALGVADIVCTLEGMNSYISKLAGFKVSPMAPYLLANPDPGDSQSARSVIDVSRGIGFYHEGVGAA